MQKLEKIRWILLRVLNILDVWLGGIHVLKSSFSIICVVNLTRISTAVEKNVEEIVLLPRFFRNWPNKSVPDLSNVASHKMPPQATWIGIC